MENRESRALILHIGEIGIIRMIDTRLDADDLIDALMDLKHDLGKYIKLPFAMLPDDASSRELEEALRTAVFETRRGPNGVQSAEALWSGFLSEAGDSVEVYPSSGELKTLVERVLDHGARLKNGESMDWASVKEDIFAVGPAIAQLIEEISNE